MAEKRGRPNQLDDILLAAAATAAQQGFTLRDVAEDAEDLRKGRLSSRGLNFAALRLFRQGRLVRHYEFSALPGSDRATVRIYRYWLPEHAPTGPVEG